MALVYATKNGDWSDTTVWNTGMLPTSVDIVRPNNFTVTIDIDVTVTEIRNDASAPAVAGGFFILNGGITVNSTIIAGQANAASGPIIQFSNSGTSTINGNITNVSTNAQYRAVSNDGSGTLNINGDVIFTQNNQTNTIQGLIENTSGGVINIIGTVSGNLLGNNRAYCVINVSIGTINITGDVNSSAVTSTPFLFVTVVNVSTGTITINGNLTSLNTSAGICVENRSTGIVNITGNLVCNNSTNGRCVVNSTGTVTITGDVTISQAGSGQNHRAILNSGSGTVNVIGTVNGAGGVSNGINICIDNESNGTVNVIGTVNGLSIVTSTIFHTTILNDGGGTLNITGTVNAGSVTGTVGQSTINNGGNSIVNITGNCQGSSGIALTSSSGTVTINGNVIGGSTNVTVVNSSTGTINLNGNAIGGSSFIAIEGVNAAGNTIIERAVYTAQGQSPIGGYIKFKTTNPEIDVLREDSVIVTLRDPLNVSGLLPSPGDVRSGTTYNSGSSTGTLAIPANNLVQLGVPVGATFGTTNLTPGDFWNYLTSGITQSGSIGERLKESSTVDTTLAQIASFS